MDVARLVTTEVTRFLFKRNVALTAEERGALLAAFNLSAVQESLDTEKRSLANRRVRPSTIAGRERVHALYLARVSRAVALLVLRERSAGRSIDSRVAAQIRAALKQDPARASLDIYPC